jgi:hypothetical protein
MPKKFEGDLNYIDPSFLVSKKGNPRIEGFFIGLGVVFNDMKGLVLFEKLILDEYETPVATEVSSHVGNYGGVMIQIQKLMVSTIHEFFIFLKKNSDVFTTPEFKEVLSKLSKADRQLWDGLLAAAHGRLSTVADLLKAIVQVRSNIAFHYDHSGKILRNAYSSRFFGNVKDGKTDYAYYSIGDKIALTRFYFSDAAVEEALYIAAGKKPKENSVGDASLEKFKGQVRETINVMSSTISALMKNYIQFRRNQSHS